MTDFKRDHGRYIVIKLKDLDEQQIDDLRGNLVGIRTRECVVVEPDWPIYEETWENVQRLAEGRPSIGDERDALVAQVREAQKLVRIVQNERDALAAQLDALRGPAVELADTVENRADLPIHKWALKCAQLVPRIQKAGKEAPTTSLARLKAQAGAEARKQVTQEWELALPRLKAEWQAEALSEMIAAIPFSEELAREMLKHKRDELRRQAEGGDHD